MSAHEAPVTCAVASPCGRFLATASERGTLVRVHAVPGGSRVASFRRGSRPAALRALAWLSPPATSSRPAFVGDAPIVLAAASESTTVHIFAKGVRRPSASAAVASAAGGFLASVAGMLSAATSTPASDGAARADEAVAAATGVVGPPRGAGTTTAGAGPASAPSSLAPAASAGPSSGPGSRGPAPATSRRAGAETSSSAGSASFGAAVSEVVHTGLRIGGVEGERSFAMLRRSDVDGAGGPAVTGLSLRWVSPEDWACGVPPPADGKPALEALVVLSSGAVLRYCVDGTAGGEGRLVGEGRITVDDEDEERGVRGGGAVGQGLGLGLAVALPPPGSALPPPGSAVPPPPSTMAGPPAASAVHGSDAASEASAADEE